MSYFSMFILFIAAFFKTLKATFFTDVMEVLQEENKEVKLGVYSKEYIKGHIRLLEFLRVDATLTPYELRQIKFDIHIPKASQMYAWINEYEKVVDIYINNPLIRGTEDVYIPSTLTSFFNISEEHSLLDYLSEPDGICAIVPFLTDVNNKFEDIYKKINTIEDDIMRDYYRNKLSANVVEIHNVIKETIDWVISYDRPK